MQKQHVGFFTRAQVARIFLVHITTVRRWEANGKLAFVIDARGWRQFPRDAVIAMAAEAGRAGSVPGALAGQAFELFAQRKSWRDVVPALRIQPEQARRLYELYWADDPNHGEAAPGDAITPAPTEARAVLAKSRATSDAEHAKSLAEWERELAAALQRTREQNEREQRDWEERRAAG